MSSLISVVVFRLSLMMLGSIELHYGIGKKIVDKNVGENNKNKYRYYKFFCSLRQFKKNRSLIIKINEEP